MRTKKLSQERKIELAVLMLKSQVCCYYYYYYYYYYIIIKQATISVTLSHQGWFRVTLQQLNKNVTWMRLCQKVLSADCEVQQLLAISLRMTVGTTGVFLPLAETAAVGRCGHEWSRIRLSSYLSHTIHYQIQSQTLCSIGFVRAQRLWEWGGGKVEEVWGHKSPIEVQGRSAGRGLEQSPQKPKNIHNMNFALRFPLLNACHPFYSSYNIMFVIGFSISSHISDFESTILVSHPHTMCSHVLSDLRESQVRVQGQLASPACGDANSALQCITLCSYITSLCCTCH